MELGQLKKNQSQLIFWLISDTVQIQTCTVCGVRGIHGDGGCTGTGDTRGRGIHGDGGYTGTGDTRGRGIHGDAGYTGTGDTRGRGIHGDRGYTGTGDTRGRGIHGYGGYTGTGDTRGRGIHGDGGYTGTGDTLASGRRVCAAPNRRSNYLSSRYHHNYEKCRMQQWLRLLLVCHAAYVLLDTLS